MTVLGDYLYRCSAGETFDTIALIVYGNERYACELMNANPQYAAKSRFTGGEKLALPVLDTAENEADEGYVSDVPPWKE